LVDASDTDGPITKVELSIDGGAYDDITANFDGTNYYYDWNTNIGDGDHTLQARATDNAGQPRVSDLVTVVVDNVNDPPVAAFNVGCGGLTCNFNASGSNDPDGSISSYAWDFGDANGGSGVTPEHTYGTAGTYPVTLIVTDNDGAPSAPELKNVPVSDAAPNPEDIGCSPNFGSLNQRLSVTVSGTGFQNGATVDFGARIAVQGVTFVDATELTVRIKIQRRANTGPRDVTVTNLDGGSGTGVVCFTVNQ
jgi:PKD repeat protein